MPASRTLGTSRRPPARLARERRRRPAPPRDGGQAVVEFVALLPIFVLVALALGQAAVAGYAQWSVAGAARVAARAEAIGGDRQRAVRAALPRVLHGELTARIVPVRRAQGRRPAVAAGTVEVRLRVPSILPGLRFGRVRARAQLPAQAAG